MTILLIVMQSPSATAVSLDRNILKKKITSYFFNQIPLYFYDRGSVPSEEVMPGFSWVIWHKLSGMAKPGLKHPLEEDLASLMDQGIDLLVSLTEKSIDPVIAATYDIDVLHIPVKDFTAPTVQQLATFIDQASAVMQNGGRVGVHCFAGKGRTGTFLAAYFVYQGMLPAEAIDHVRELRPGSIETPEQEAVIFAYYDSLQQ
ncbi:MAG: dual specificity protein phosphatase family protein [Deltaproteobacteria bacterium]|nr:dual specificity protein phosphatase family protein [Deltaproteobacteria bacterium]